MITISLKITGNILKNEKPKGEMAALKTPSPQRVDMLTRFPQEPSVRWLAAVGVVRGDLWQSPQGRDSQRPHAVLKGPLG